MAEKRAAPPRVSIIDGNTNTVSQTVAVGSGAPDWLGGIAVNTVTKRVYVTHDGTSVTVIDGTTGSVIPTIAVAGGPFGVAVNEVVNRVYVSLSGSNDLAIINGVTNSVIDTVPVGLGPAGIAADPNTGRIYVANAGDNTISVLAAKAAVDIDIRPGSNANPINPNSKGVIPVAIVGGAGLDVDVSSIRLGRMEPRPLMPAILRAMT
ncbi:MAG: YncE family protein [SAR202 cluster bacterium]|nr:YncE family protein [SAR202 cluster bacterium]